MTRFTSFVLLVTLAGMPAVAAACAMLCQPGAFHHASSATTATANTTADVNHDEHDAARTRVDASRDSGPM
jgi:hypothetical protein